jgi:hypothetical protein
MPSNRALLKAQQLNNKKPAAKPSAWCALSKKAYREMLKSIGKQ